MRLVGSLLVSALMLGVSLHGSRAVGSTLVVTVREHGGEPVDGAAVVAVLLADDGNAPADGPAGAAWSGRRRPSGIDGLTDLHGEARLEVPAGRYQVGVWRCDDPLLVLPERNPRAPPVRVDVGEGTAEARIELWRGRRVRFELEANRAAPNVTVHPVSADGLTADDVVLRETRMYADVVLLPGRWIFSADVVPGWLLTDLRVDGASVPGSEARLEIAPGASTLVLTWVVEGQAVLGGSILVEAPIPCYTDGATATLLEPGPWIAAALPRGGSVYEVVEAPLDDPKRCTFSMILPSGRWGIAPRLRRDCIDDTEAPEVALAPAATAWVRLHGTCDLRDGAAAQALVPLPVSVVDADGTALDDALVEVTMLDQPQAGEPEGPFSGRTRWGGFVSLSVPPGHSWRIVAGHLDHLDAATDIERWSPSPSVRPDPVTITLARASTVRVHALDATSKPQPGVVVSLEAKEEPNDLLVDATFKAHRRGRAVTTDADGQALMRGFYPVEVSMVAAIRGADRESWIISLGRKGDELSDVQPLGFALVEGEEATVEVRVRPAARLLAHLSPRCARIPDETELAVVPAARLAPDQDDVDALLLEPTLARERLPRSGADELELEIGPLATGRYLLAVRPAGFERWTLWPGTEVAFEADAIEAVEGEVVRLEGLTIDCAPVAEIRLHPPLDGRSPDMRLAEVTATWKPVDPKREPVALSDRRLPTRVRLSGMPTGNGVIAATLRHPHLLPSDLVTIEQSVDLHDGSLALLEKDVAGIGGAIVVTTAAPYVRIRPTEGEDPGRVVLADAGRASLASLRAGSWTLTECADASCATTGQSWAAIVEPYRTLTLP